MSDRPVEHKVDSESRDLGQAVAAQLALIHSIFKTADEVYRIFRGQIESEDAENRTVMPVEWIPVSDH